MKAFEDQETGWAGAKSDLRGNCEKGKQKQYQDFLRLGWEA